MKINTRDQAVKYILDKGFYAKKRDWSLGEAIVIAEKVTESSGVKALHNMWHLYPNNNKQGEWLVSDQFLKEDEVTNFNNLEAATHYLTDLLISKN